MNGYWQMETASPVLEMSGSEHMLFYYAWILSGSHQDNDH